MVAASFSIDTTDLLGISRIFANGPRIVQEELIVGMDGGVVDLYGDVRDLTPECRTKQLRASLVKEVSQSAKSVSGTVKSLGGVAPYNAIVHDGRGPIVAKPGKTLRLVLCDGTILFRKRVGPAKANPFMDKGLAKATPKILQRFEDTAGRIVFRLVGAQ